jgi:hypothetical protein
MRANTLFHAAVFALVATAQNDFGLPKIGPSRPGIGNTPEALQVSADAGRQPNATDSVTFTRAYNNTQEEWTWRINVTDISVPNRIDDLGMPGANFSQGLHIANVQWQLEWPGDEVDSLQTYLMKRNMSVGFTALISNKPSSITDRYSDSDNGNCTAVLGDKCTQSITQFASEGDMVSFTGLEGCADSLDVQGGGGVQSGTGFSKTPPITS